MTKNIVVDVVVMSHQHKIASIGYLCFGGLVVIVVIISSCRQSLAALENRVFAAFFS